MGLFDRFTQWAERRNLRSELNYIYRHELEDSAQSRVHAINERLAEMSVGTSRVFAYMHAPVVEDDCGAPEGLVGARRTPA